MADKNGNRQWEVVVRHPDQAGESHEYHSVPLDHDDAEALKSYYAVCGHDVECLPLR